MQLAIVAIVVVMLLHLQRQCCSFSRCNSGMAITVMGVCSMALARSTSRTRPNTQATSCLPAGVAVSQPPSASSCLCQSIMICSKVVSWNAMSCMSLKF